MEKRYSHIVPFVNEDNRLSDYLVGVFPLLTTRQSVKKALKRQEIFVDGNIGYSGDYVREGQQIEHRKILATATKAVNLDIVYEDEHLLIVNKPPGIKTSGKGSETMEMALILYGNNSTEVDALMSPQLIHRLDRDTTGLLIAAKTKMTLDRLSTLIQNGKIDKEYTAISEGYLTDNQIFIESNIDDKSAKTEILQTKKLATKDATTFVRIALHTGRTHQIRRHLKSIGHPIVGDIIYNEHGLKFGRGLFLQAVKLSFKHPMTSEQLNVEILPHKKFLKYMKE